MNEGKAPGPKWWSRPSVDPTGQPHAGVEPVRDEPVEADSVREDALPGESVRPEPGQGDVVRDGAVRDDAVRDGVVRDDAVQGGVVRDDAVRDDAVSGEPARRVPASEELARDDAVRDGLVRDGLVRDSLVRDGLVRDAPGGGEASGARNDSGAWDGSDAPAVPDVSAGAAFDVSAGPGVGAVDDAAALRDAAPEARPIPRHDPDPYSTPPYGEPGPWAPAPPVQRPMPTPAHGTQLPPHYAHPPHPGMTPAHGTAMPPHPASQPGDGQPPQPVPPHQHEPVPPHPHQQVPHPHQPVSPHQQVPPHHPAHQPHPQPHSQPHSQPQLPLPPHPQAQPAQSHPQGVAGVEQQSFPLHASAQHSGGAPQGPHAPHGAHGAQVPHGTPAVPQWQHYDPWRASSGGAGAPAAGRPRRRRRSKVVIGAMLLALLAGGIGGGIGVYVEQEGDDTEQIQLPQASADTQQARDPDSIAGIAARALPSVVTIHVKGAGEKGTGTGFVLDKRGNILTNNHVVEPADQAGGDSAISVTFNGGQTASAKVIGRDSGYDLAVIRVEGVSGLKPLALGNSDSVRVGDPVVAIGAPYDLAGTVTSGIISAKERPITAGGEKADGSDISYVDALQTDAPINPGNSGGPLVDSKGRVIGINSVIRAANDGGLGGGQGGSIGLGFAIPINQGKRVAEELINSGKATHPVIGVTLDMKFGGDGARVAMTGSGGPAVTKDGPGDKAGIRPSDVITEVDGVPVHSGQELIVKIRSHRPGDRLKLSVERDGDERPVELTLGSASDVER
ncbi:trypsin-like peptidase domain-containing protein [Streptomyces zagrosensis]|uniref:Putative serine protease PepD n=1 Tax=Streptomyces zagrosensis TaxID=1042984 RepID=A0A7W9QAX2_9ACTN|nr:trypsin-like peptidase domain-containing protein [Streptomyces zagrosensis]MBB5936769.1 putative serine protease PepD [Streptomyces zagrosensis]